MTEPLYKLAQRLRPLPIALAHAYAQTKPTEQPRLEALNRLYHALKAGEQLQCRGELLACRNAKRGNHEAQISEPIK